MNFLPLLIMVSLFSIPFLAIYLMLKLWIKHREKISDAILENTELKKEIEALKFQKNEAQKYVVTEKA